MSGRLEQRPALMAAAGGAALRLSPLDLRELEQVLEAMLEALGFTGVTEFPGLSLFLVEDRAMEDYNRQAMDLPGPTNVLSFPSTGPAFYGGFPESAEEVEACGFSTGKVCNRELGELVLSVDALRRESRLYSQDESEHMLRLLAHGLGHLGGAGQLGQGGLDHGEKHDKLSRAAFTAGLSHLQKIRSIPHE